MHFHSSETIKELQFNKTILLIENAEAESDFIQEPGGGYLLGVVGSMAS